MRLVLLALLVACGDQRHGVDAVVVSDGSIEGMLDLFGEPCTQPPFPEVGLCHDGQGACTDETAGSVCRPFCYAGGMPQCQVRQGVEHTTDRGTCVCVPP